MALYNKKVFKINLFFKYQILNHHSLDQCFCFSCMRIVKEHLEFVEAQKLTLEKRKMVKYIIFSTIEIKSFLQGSISKNETKSKSFTSITKKISEKIKINPIRLIQEEVFFLKKFLAKVEFIKGITEIYNNLCEKCRIHCDSFTHLCGGRDMQHVLTDAEIKCLGMEMNKGELLELLIIEKGNAAKIMIENLPTDEPKDLILKKELIQILFKDLQTDFYNRYEFNDLQQ